MKITLNWKAINRAAVAECNPLMRHYLCRGAFCEKEESQSLHNAPSAIGSPHVWPKREPQHLPYGYLTGAYMNGRRENWRELPPPSGEPRGGTNIPPLIKPCEAWPWDRFGIRRATAEHLEDCLVLGADSNVAAGIHGYLILYAAIDHGNPRFVQILLAAGANPDGVADSSRGSPLHVAVVAQDTVGKCPVGFGTLTNEYGRWDAFAQVVYVRIQVEGRLAQDWIAQRPRQLLRVPHALQNPPVLQIVDVRAERTFSNELSLRYFLNVVNHDVRKPENALEVTLPHGYRYGGTYADGTPFLEFVGLDQLFASGPSHESLSTSSTMLTINSVNSSCHNDSGTGTRKEQYDITTEEISSRDQGCGGECFLIKLRIGE